MDTQDKRFALLIDGDNIGSQYVRAMIDEITKEGVITYKRAYGDWTKPNLAKWKDVLLNLSITPIQQYAYTTGKNATDSAMIIDAMDILYTGQVDGFCLASSDSDFTRLAARLREAGMVVIGMGQRHTPQPFVAACSMFKYIEVISNESDEQGDTKKTEGKKAGASKPASAKPKQKTVPALDEKTQKTVDYIRNAIDEKSEDDGWMLVSLLGNMLQKAFTDFDPRNFGEKKLIDLLKKWGFETKAFQDPNNKANPSGNIIYVRNKTK